MSDSPKDKTSPLLEKVQSWLETEGFPLEFRVADAFGRAGFNTSQGLYVKDHNTGETREIDVLSDTTLRLKENKWFRISQMIECKWSKDKPWVVFTSPESRMMESACIAQAIGSSLGEAVMFCIAGDSDLHQLQLFKRPDRGGFGGRRAFEKQEKERYDQFYRAIQGLVANAVSRAKDHDRPEKRRGEVPDSGLLIFPVLVVDGNLFEVFYNQTTSVLEVKEVNQIRMLWRGSAANRRAITPVDIVTATSVEAFAHSRAAEVKTLIGKIGKSVANVEQAFAEKQFETLVIQPGPRGFIGLPPLLRDLHILDQSRVKEPNSNK